VVQTESAAIVRRIGDFVGGAFGLFLGVGSAPIWAGALIARALGWHNLSENIFIFGMLIWIAMRTFVGWRMSVAWRNAEALRMKEGRESPGDIMRREEWEKKTLRRKEYLREAMRLRAEAKKLKNGKGST
jgi:hypothetical protein